MTDSPFKDSLTGLFNHGFFQISLEMEVKRSRRYGGPFTLALLDIDSFNGYNRKHGHGKGDWLLKEMARIIRESIRKVDLAARYSGDVFALVLTNSSVEQALALMERIRQAATGLSGSEMTVSIGLASYPGDAVLKENLIRRAEDALLQAKLKGRNRIDFSRREIKPVEDPNSRILVVDDEPQNLKLLEALLVPLHYDVIKASNGKEAISLVQKTGVDLVLLDVMMPEMNGYEVCRRIKGNEETRLIPVVMLTALDDMKAKINGIEAGADDFLTKPPNKMELLTRVKTLIKVKGLNDNLTSLESVLFSLANVVEAKDEYTKGHIWRVAELAVALGERVGLTEKNIRALKLGGMIHDIGKIGIPKEILNKPGPLSPDEREVMKNHANIGYRICLPLEKTLGTALEIIRYHHEKLDGSGYPEGLRGEEIPICAQVMAVVDIYDALVSDRPYRKKISNERAAEILLQETTEGRLDRQIVEYLIEIIR